MGLKDLIKNVDVSNLRNASFAQGMLGNYSSFSIEDATKEYGMYLMNEENIVLGFKLIRDVLLFTDKRIILVDKQGVTGKKTSIVSINLSSIVDVEMETAGFGFDDSELTFTYIKTPHLKARHIEYVKHKLEFPKKYDVQSLYKLLQELAYENYLSLNGLQQ